MKLAGIAVFPALVLLWVGVSYAGRDGQQRTARSAGTFELNWNTVDAGGVTFSSGGDFQLGGTAGQHDANVPVMAGGVFELRGGFWPGIGAPASSCPWDLNDDGAVGAADLAQLLGNWGPNPGHAADFNGDGAVGAADLAQLLGNWGPCG